jgi:hypothetical protein
VVAKYDNSKQVAEQGAKPWMTVTSFAPWAFGLIIGYGIWRFTRFTKRGGANDVSQVEVAQLNSQPSADRGYTAFNAQHAVREEAEGLLP